MVSSCRVGGILIAGLRADKRGTSRVSRSGLGIASVGADAFVRPASAARLSKQMGPGRMSPGLRVM